MSTNTYPVSKLDALTFFRNLITDPTKNDAKWGLNEMEYIDIYDDGPLPTIDSEFDVMLEKNTPTSFIIKGINTPKTTIINKLENLKNFLEYWSTNDNFNIIAIQSTYVTENDVSYFFITNIPHNKTEIDKLIQLINDKLNHRSLFVPRIKLKPYEYPELIPHADAINQAYWLFTEYNYTGDVQNFKVDITEYERNVITKAMLGISQIEVTVKRFWGDLYWYFQKPEVDIFGASASDSEARHLRAYSELLNILGMDEVFIKLEENKPLMRRVEYIESFLRDRKNSDADSVLSLMLFSMFIEHISLFSQFLIIQSFNKERNQFKGMANAISATQLEEEIHGNFGVALYQIIRTEHPELFTTAMFDKLHELADKAFEAEMGIVDWIYEGGDLEFLTKEETKNYLKYRYNKSYKSLGFEPKYVVDTDMLDKVRWFEVELTATKENDFFNKRNTDYSKKGKSISADDLF